jgi:hypothetical protein
VCGEPVDLCVLGIEAVSRGDYAGPRPFLSKVPKQLPDEKTLDLKKILGENSLRVVREVTGA